MLRCSWVSRIILIALSFVALLIATSIALACDLCGVPTPTLAEMLAQADAVVQARWIGNEKGKAADDPGTTIFEVTIVVRDKGNKLKPRDRVTVDGQLAGKKGEYKFGICPPRIANVTTDGLLAGKKGDLFLLVGRQADKLEWDSPQKVSEAGFKYLVEAPALDAPPAERLAYFLRFLEVPDYFVANDAFAEFVRAPFEDIVLLTDQLPREKLRRWLVDPKVPEGRRGLYGLMLGLCGEPSDVKLLEEIIARPAQETRPGIEGIMGGYLLLAGEKGLEVIEKTKFQNRDIVTSETYSAMQAVRFLWSNGGGRFSRGRVQQSARLLLDNADFTELVVADLARWKDWSVTPKLMEMYGVLELKDARTKLAIVRYLLTAASDTVPPASEISDIPQTELPHVIEAKKCLETLRERDPKTVSQVERSFRPARIGIKTR
ncbi:MAG: hypothetical protein HZA46_12820 [Planctomycetales bacterium]|nr:hypothetical protein [Planctomycetales bacterium]